MRLSRKIEAGNVTLPLTGTLIKGSQSLFGIKTQLQFGRLGVTTIFHKKGSVALSMYSGRWPRSLILILMVISMKTGTFIFSQYFQRAL